MNNFLGCVLAARPKVGLQSCAKMPRPKFGLVFEHEPVMDLRTKTGSWLCTQ